MYQNIFLSETYVLTTKYFFVEKFYETDLKKITPRVPMGTRIFDLTQVLGTEGIPDTDKLTQHLMNESWT